MTISVDVFRCTNDFVGQKKAFGAQVEWNQNVSFPFEKCIEVFKSLLGSSTIVKFDIV